MGLFELIGVLLSFLVGAVGLGLWWGLVRQAREQPPRRAPLVLWPVVASGASVPLALGLSLALGHSLIWQLLGTYGAEGYLYLDPLHAFWPSLQAAGALFLWLGPPGLLALAWLLASRSRSLAVAAWLSAGWGLGFGAGGVLARALLLPHLMEWLGMDMVVSLPQAVGVMLEGMVALGLATALPPVVGALTWSHPRRMLGLSVLFPAVAAVLGAVLTPPDVLSQLLVAGGLCLGWGVGLVGGLLVKRRSRQGAPSSWSTHSMGSTASPPTTRVQCRWGPVLTPVEPTAPSCWPRTTRCPSSTSMRSRWE